MFLLWLRQLPWCGDRTPASVPPPAKGRSSPTNTPVFPPSSFILPSFAWVYVFFSIGQVLLSALSWCSACTSVSEGIFLMYPWREMYSPSTYSSAILSIHDITVRIENPKEPPSPHRDYVLDLLQGLDRFTEYKVIYKEQIDLYTRSRLVQHKLENVAEWNYRPSR